MKFVNLEDVIERLQYWSGGFDYIEVPTDYAVEQMESLPMFELVRCKECKWLSGAQFAGVCYTVCIYDSHPVQRAENDFCSLAERREE